ncbi:hypothetical protein [Tropicibacter sp. S64]|uniref:hypothetical protein n=1 Tax=Tropicibacter sp. S64 TaxID=3415122 RepID=UPI003C7A0315
MIQITGEIPHSARSVGRGNVRARPHHIFGVNAGIAACRAAFRGLSARLCHISGSLPQSGHTRRFPAWFIRFLTTIDRQPEVDLMSPGTGEKEKR